MYIQCILSTADIVVYNGLSQKTMLKVIIIIIIMVIFKCYFSGELIALSYKILKKRKKKKREALYKQTALSKQAL